MDNVGKWRLKRARLITVIVSAISSAAIAALLHLFLFAPQSAQIQKKAVKDRSPEVERSREKDFERPEREVEEVEGRVRATRDKIQITEKRIAELETRESTSTESPIRDVLKRLLDIRDPNRRREIKKAVSDLLEFGNEAIPLIVEVLKSEMDSAQSHLRSALVDVLCRLDTPEAKTALFRELENPRTLSEVVTTLGHFEETEDAEMIRGLSPALYQALTYIHQGKPGFADKAGYLFYRYLDMAARKWGLVKDPKFQLLVTSMAEGMKPENQGCRALLGLIVEVSPEDAWRILYEKMSRPEKPALGDLAPVLDSRVCREMDLSNYIRFLQMARSASDLAPENRSIVRALGIRLTAGALRREGREGLQDLLDFMKESRDAETDPADRRNFDAMITRLEEKLKD
jgi:hypothetical protein